MKKYKVVLVSFVICAMLSLFSCVYAVDDMIANYDKHEGDKDNYASYQITKSDGTRYDCHSRTTYSLDGNQAFCIEPGVPISWRVWYIEDNGYASPEIRARITAALKYGGYDIQYRQVVCWMLIYQVRDGKSDGSIISESGDGNLAQELFDKVMSFTWDGSVLSTPRSDVSFEGSLSFNYDAGSDAYVSNTVTAKTSGSTTLTLNGAPSGAYMVVDGEVSGTSKGISSDKSVYVVVPRTVFSGTYNLNLHLTGGADYYTFTPATAYKAHDARDPVTNADLTPYIDLTKYRQQLAIPGSMTSNPGTGEASTYGSVSRPLGNLNVGKVDKYGNYMEGAYFHITGPYGFDQYVTTVDGVTSFNNIDTGVYTVTELTAPYGMILNSTPVNVTVQENQTVLATLRNEFQRGGVRITKYDSINRGTTKGDATIAGAVFNLYAGETIKEGKTLIYSENQLVQGNIRTNADGSTNTIDNLPLGKYYYVEATASTGFNLNTDRIYVTISYNGQTATAATYNGVECAERPILSHLRIVKKLGATDYDPEITLSGVQFKATLNSDPNQVYYSNVSGQDGVCEIRDIPYGTYTISECKLNDAGYKVADWTVFFEIENQTYEYSRVIDNPKMMKIAVTKEITLREGEATDATVRGAIFTVYRDAACTNKVCDIGPTDANGYAISGTMRTGTYYMKETTFPVGIDPDCVMPDGVTTYRNKIYTISEDNKTQGPDIITHPITIQNEPNRNHIEIYKEIGKTSNTNQFPLDKCEFTATLKSTIGTANVFSRKCTAETTRDTGYCIIEDLPYGTYVIEETKVSPITLKCANFEVFVSRDKKVKTVPYVPADGNFLATTLPEHIGTTKNYAASYKWLDDNGHIVDIPKVMQIKVRKVDYDRTNVNPVYYTQGDGVLKGARYQIYRYDPRTDDYTEEVYVITVDHQDSEGYWCAESRDLLVGKYMVKEIIKNSEVGTDGRTYDYSYAEGYLVDPNTYYFEQQPDLQTVRETFQTGVSKEKILRGNLKVVKYDNEKNNSSQDTNPSEESPSQGAILRLVLDSSIPASAVYETGKETDYYMQGTIYYEVTLDKDGYGEFRDINDANHKASVTTCYGNAYYPDTIPYGKYTLIETKESNPSEHTHFYTKPESVEIRKQTQKEYRIVADEPVPMYLQVQKWDEDKHTKVALVGATFKIWDVTNEKFVKQLSSTDHNFIEEFVTNEEGLMTTPEKLNAGEYIVYEVHSPEGYYLEEKYRLPANRADYGDETKGGVKVVIDKVVMNVKENTISNTLDYFYIVDVEDRPLMSKLVIDKKGEMLTSARTESTPYGEKHTPIYEPRGLPGVTYEIYAAEDIKTPDGRYTYVPNGTKVDTITTNNSGIATTKELYPGEYRIVETVTPLGYIADTNIPNITLESSHDELVRVKETKKDLNNKKQPTEITIEKVLEHPEYDVPQDQIKVIVGIYSNEELKSNYNNQVVIGKDKLLDIVEGTVTAGETLTLKSNVNLPKGNYYAKELYVDYPYTLDTEKAVFEVRPRNTTDALLEVYGIVINNVIPKAAELGFVKISTSALINEAEAVKGGILTQAEYDKIMNPIVEWVNSNPTSTVKAVFNGEMEPNDPNIAKCRLDSRYTLSSAVYSVYYDEEKTMPLTKGGVPVNIVTDEKGFASLQNVPIGEYYLFEEVAPVVIWGDSVVSYEKSEEPIQVILTNLDKEANCARLLTDEMQFGKEFVKTDIFTGELIPNCTFVVTDADGNDIVRATTNEEGEFKLKLDWFNEGETYYYTEIEAPGIYDLNTEPHEFKIEFDEDGALVKVPVENRRKTRELLIRKTDAETGELLPGCVFTIALVDENGEQVYHAQTGEPVYLAENAVTDENGEYYIEDAPMGRYKFLEITPPEGYELDEDLTGYIFEITPNSPELIIFEVTNTGDIAVYALVGIAIASVLGIAYVMKKRLSSAK